MLFSLITPEKGFAVFLGKGMPVYSSFVPSSLSYFPLSLFLAAYPGLRSRGASLHPSCIYWSTEAEKQQDICDVNLDDRRLTLQPVKSMPDVPLKFQQRHQRVIGNL